MKHFLIKYSVLAFLFIIIGFAVVYSLHVKYLYLNAEGKKRAVCLAHALVKLYDKEGRIPNDFLQEVGFFFSDKRSNKFELRIKDESEFEIEYRPHSTWIFQLSNNNSQVLKIKWNKEMDDIRIESSIKLP